VSGEIGAVVFVLVHVGGTKEQTGVNKATRLVAAGHRLFSFKLSALRKVPWGVNGLAPRGIVYKLTENRLSVVPSRAEPRRARCTPVVGCTPVVPLRVDTGSLLTCVGSLYGPSSQGLNGILCRACLSVSGNLGPLFSCLFASVAAQEQTGANEATRLVAAGNRLFSFKLSALRNVPGGVNGFAPPRDCDKLTENRLSVVPSRAEPRSARCTGPSRAGPDTSLLFVGHGD
jgi:hypothetical protein